MVKREVWQNPRIVFILVIVIGLAVFYQNVQYSGRAVGITNIVTTANRERLPSEEIPIPSTPSSPLAQTGPSIPEGYPSMANSPSTSTGSIGGAMITGISFTVDCAFEDIRICGGERKVVCTLETEPIIATPSTFPIPNSFKKNIAPNMLKNNYPAAVCMYVNYLFSGTPINKGSLRNTKNDMDESIKGALEEECGKDEIRNNFNCELPVKNKGAMCQLTTLPEDITYDCEVVSSETIKITGEAECGVKCTEIMVV